MKALTILNPWAHGIIHLGKDIENRDWRTKERGTVAIHAGAKFVEKEFEYFFDVLSSEGEKEISFSEITDNLVYGAIIGVADIVDCVSNHPSPWFYGKWGFVLENPRALKSPIPWKGKLNFWNVPAEIEAEIWRQLDE